MSTTNRHLFCQPGLARPLQLCKSILLVALTSVALSFAVVACGGSAPAEAPTPTPLPARAIPSKLTYRVERGTVVESVEFTGRIVAVQEEQLYFRSDGRVGKLNVKKDDKVKKGDVLAELDMSDMLNQLAQAQVNLQQAQIRLKSVQDTNTSQQLQLEIALESARLRLAQIKVRDPSPTIAIAAATRDKAEAAVQAAQAAYDATGRRGDSGAALALQRATQDYEIARSQYTLALQSQSIWQYDIQLQELAVRQADSNLQSTQTAVDPGLSQEVAKAQLAVDRLNTQIANGRIVAPFDGEITVVGIAAGQNTAAFRAVIGIAVPGALEVSTDPTSEILQKLNIGQKATLTSVYYPGKEFTATIRRIPAAAESSTTDVTERDRTTRLTLDGDTLPERGTLMQVSVVLQQKVDVLWLPPAAINSFQNRWFVLGMDGDTQRRITVVPGIISEDRVEIVSGVDEGQVVVGL